ncbi:DUF2757 family protein [Polycladomyces sp. WAk]|uniref:DUF2757 family protein n=1 Tax=Polycladomyces zharkentensis TaxID=2807616 RepID=A0ABS2WM72_9BACL|nr:anti-sigma-F factor Fin [Polycladomyces sp. WAk]MBN2910667.1 DUF2757 family protein [Polycladomyces sp. WAk]
MEIRYVCRICDQTIGQLSAENITEWQLGFHWLTPDERKDIISDDMDGGTLVKVVCETCQEMLNRSPELSLLPRPLQ